MQNSFCVLLHHICCIIVLASVLLVGGCKKEKSYVLLQINVSGEGHTDPFPGRYEFEKHSIVNLKAIPNQNSAFEHWDGDVDEPNNPEASITLNRNETITAVFKYMPYRKWRLVQQRVLPSWAYSVKWHPSGNIYASCGWGGVALGTYPEIYPINGLYGPSTDYITYISWAPDGIRIAGSIGGWGSGIYETWIWDRTTGNNVGNLIGHTGWVHQVAYSADGNYLATCSDDQSVIIWDAHSFEPVMHLKAHIGFIRAVDWSKSSDLVASGADDEKVFIWNAESGQLVKQLIGHSRYIHDVKFSPDGNYVASASNDKSVKIWSVATGECIHTLNHAGIAICIDWSPDSKFLASASQPSDIQVRDAPIRIWEIGTGSLIAQFEDIHTGIMSSVSWSGDGKTIVYSKGHSRYFWESYTSD